MNERFKSSVNVPGFQNLARFGIATGGISSIAGKYNYTAAQPHAVSSVNGIVANPIPSTTYSSAVTTDSYNAENKILTIDNGTTRNEFTYGVDGNRFRCDYYTVTAGVKTYQSSKVYIGGSEFGYFPTTTKNYARTIIKAPTGTCALYQDSAGVKEFYYIHTDYQGSWLAITNSAKVVKNRYSYDAWGRPRNVNDWTLKTINIGSELVNLNAFQPRFDRGYTGHEMVCGFGLINMNGRLYDPYLQRFLSPDPYVQSPGNAQDYNRYSYCLNNPLMYIDPSGYNIKNWWHEHGNQVAAFAIAAVVGAAVGIATAGIGDIVAAGFMSGFAAGFAGGFAGTALNGGTLDQCMFSAVTGGWAGGASGAAVAGVFAGAGAIANNIKAPTSWGPCPAGGGNVYNLGSASLGNWATSMFGSSGSTAAQMATAASRFTGASVGAFAGVASFVISSTLQSFNQGAIGPPMAGGGGGSPSVNTSSFAYNNQWLNNSQILNSTNGSSYSKSLYFNSNPNCGNNCEYVDVNGNQLKVNLGATKISNPDIGKDIFDNFRKSVYYDSNNSYFRTQVLGTNGYTEQYGYIPRCSPYGDDAIAW